MNARPSSAEHGAYGKGRTKLRPLLLRRFSRDRKGATVIEFAIVVLPFLMTFYAILQVGLLFFIQSMIETGVAEAARMVRTGQVQSQGLSEANIRSLVCEHVHGFFDCEGELVIDVRAFPSFADANVPPAVGADGEVNGTTQFNPGSGGEVVIFRAYASYPLPIPDNFTGLSNMSGGRRLLAATASFRNEPF